MNKHSQKNEKYSPTCYYDSDQVKRKAKRRTGKKDRKYDKVRKGTNESKYRKSDN